MASWGELREKVYGVVRDTSRTFVTEDLVDMWLTEAIEDLSTRLSIVSTSTSGTTSDNSIGLPSLFLDKIWLKVASEGASDDYVQFEDDEVWNHYEEGALTPVGTLGRIHAGNIELYPTPETGTAYTLRYWAKTSTLSDIPNYLHPKLTQYAKAMAKLHEGEDGQSDRYMAMYERSLPEPFLGYGRGRGLPDQIRWAPTTFDRDPQSMHF